ncbi:hypothetical protein [Geosporobacter ferrireducens]|uniref:hypothetical protein n=1 Tax=Geosporobacter ferrireducens TaxID=1424294 RepID=UPI00139D0346|nr:hypothetical protein [Geosporobacter ferrireducens]MTI58047.1 hypothetical protein [Geosporobacter ferrireducens]
MKKVFIIFFAFIILCVGCVEKEKQSNIESIIPDTNPKNQTKTCLSPTGEYRAEAYGTVTTITAGGLYPYEGIRVLQVDNDEIIWKMEPGYYTEDFAWSPDGRYVGIYYEARTYGESIVFDTKYKKLISLPVLTDIASYYGESVKPQENRPDPYFSIAGWENEETVVVDVRWSKEDCEYFNGQYTFNMETHNVSYR